MFIAQIRLKALSCTRQKKQYKGFTLLEILIALFIFSILSLILSTVLRNVIDVQARTERKAEQLSQLQMTLLILSRDIEQIVNRPIVGGAEKESPAFSGNSQTFTFTHTGFANPFGKLTRSLLGRTGYHWSNNTLWRISWPVLDQSPDTQAQARPLLTNVAAIQFEYLDQEGRFHRVWPLQDDQASEALPKAIKIELTLSQWGKISQLYVIPTQNSKFMPPAPKP